MPRRPQDRDRNLHIAGRIGNAVRHHREANGLSQDALAKQLTITPEAYGRLERGLSTPSFPTLMRLCEALKVTPDDLLIAEGAHLVQTVEPRRSKVANDIITILDDLSPSQQRHVLAMLRGIIGMK